MLLTPDPGDFKPPSLKWTSHDGAFAITHDRCAAADYEGYLRLTFGYLDDVLVEAASEAAGRRAEINTSRDGEIFWRVGEVASDLKGAKEVARRVVDAVVAAHKARALTPYDKAVQELADARERVEALEGAHARLLGPWAEAEGAHVRRDVNGALVARLSADGLLLAGGDLRVRIVAEDLDARLEAADAVLRAAGWVLS